MHRLGDVVDVRLVRSGSGGRRVAVRAAVGRPRDAARRKNARAARDAAMARAKSASWPQAHASKIASQARPRSGKNRTRQIEEGQVMTGQGFGSRGAQQAKSGAWKSAAGRKSAASGPRLKRGLRGRCPRCGEGKTVSRISEKWMIIVRFADRISRRTAPTIFRPISSSSLSATSWYRRFCGSKTDYAPSVPLQLAIYLPLTLILSLLLLQPVKGAVVGGAMGIAHARI